MHTEAMATMETAAKLRGPAAWRNRLRRSICTALLLKLLALVALWLLFFSPAHRETVTPEAIDARLAVEANDAETAPDEGASRD